MMWTHVFDQVFKLKLIWKTSCVLQFCVKQTLPAYHVGQTCFLLIFIKRPKRMAVPKNNKSHAPTHHSLPLMFTENSISFGQIHFFDLLQCSKHSIGLFIWSIVSFCLYVNVFSTFTRKSKQWEMIVDFFILISQKDYNILEKNQ